MLYDMCFYMTSVVASYARYITSNMILSFISLPNVYKQIVDKTLSLFQRQQNTNHTEMHKLFLTGSIFRQLRR